MNATDRARLTRALRDLVTRIGADLRGKMRAPGTARERALALHADEQVAEDFAVWTDLLARRAAALWVLRSVYVRVLEDRGLLAPGHIHDEAQQRFEKLAPDLGETAFLRRVYRDLASPGSGLPELFEPRPAEVAAPADALSRELLAFWRHRDPDTGACWSFAGERFQGELMGDLYQELDPVVKDRFALCQTPDFVRAFLLDRTLGPAIETFGADQVRLLDPACGSGHILVDGLERLVTATAAQHPDWDRRRVVTHCLDRVVGIDLNDYACALARARLLMTAAELAGVTSLAEAAAFHPHVYWADGLEQVEKDKDTRGVLGAVLAPGFHAVIANPPYITESDDERKRYHRQNVGRRQRYVSAYRQYSLGAPFTERCFQLAVDDGFVGLITANNFMKREFGKPLIEKVLKNLDLNLVVDTSHAYIPFHGTPTVLLFGRKRLPQGDSVRAVMGKRGETGTPEDPAHGRVWSSIVAGWSTVGFEDELVSVTEVSRETFAKHPWSLGGGGAVELKARLDEQRDRLLGDLVVSMGRVAHTGADGAYVADGAVLERYGLLDTQIADFVEGEKLRDWMLSSPTQIAFPYDEKLDQVRDSHTIPVIRWLWPFRAMLWERREPQGTHREIGFTWHQFSRFHPERYHGLGIAFPFVASHNHFVLDRGGKVFNRSAPVIKLPPGATEDDHLALLGLLNTSTACFWMKQVFHPKTHASQRHHPDPARAVYEFATTGLRALPVPSLESVRPQLIGLARRLDKAASTIAARLSAEALAEMLTRSAGAQALRESMTARWRDTDVLREQMVAWQEEIDWLGYVAYGLADRACLVPSERYDELTCPRGDRPFERIVPRSSTIRARKSTLAIDEGEAPPVGTLPPWAEAVWKRRVQAIEASDALPIIEKPVYKRVWRDTDQNIAEPRYRAEKDTRDLTTWMAARVESWARGRTQAFSRQQLVAALQDDPELLITAEAMTERPDFSLDALLAGILDSETVPNHPYHVYTDSGLTKRAAWEEVWALQRREDAGETIENIPVPPEYSQGSRGKATDFLRNESWHLRGKLDVPRERFIAFTEVPGREGDAALYGWAGWRPLQRIRALLAIDEELVDAGVPLADRVGVLDSARRLLPDAAREDAAAASRLEAELQALAGADGPSREMLDDWRARFPPPGSRGRRKSGSSK